MRLRSRLWRLHSHLLAAVALALGAGATVPSVAGVALQEPVILYDAPSGSSSKLLILTAGQPLREISRVDGWRKVSTFSNNTGWVLEKSVTPWRGGVVISETAPVRERPESDATIVFYAKNNVVLEVLNDSGWWVEVLHPDGETGFAHIDDVWVND